MRRIRRSASMLLAATMVASLGAGQQSPPPIFRTNADLVSVNVSVRSGNQPVTALTAADFTLSDNGVAQRVKELEMAAVPVDFTLLMAVHGSMAGNIRDIRAETVAIAKLLRPGDRLRVLEFATEIVEVFSLQPVDSPSALDRLEESFKTAPSEAVGWMSLYDALVAAMILPTTPDRRQLVIALTRASDSISVLSRDKALAVAGRTEATVYIQVFPESWDPSNETSMYARIFGNFPYLLAVEVNSGYAQEAVSEIAAATGGQAYTAGFLGTSAVDTFKRIYEEYRSSYLLQYDLTGVPREGWHDIAVKVTRPGRFNVHARRGYFIDAR